MNRISLTMVIPLIVLAALATTPITVIEDAFAKNGRHAGGDLSQAASISNSCLNPVSNSNTNDNIISNGDCGGTISQQGGSGQASTPTTVQNANPTVEVQQFPFSSPPLGGEPSAHLVVRQVFSDPRTLNPGAFDNIFAACGSDEVVTGGGYIMSSPGGRISIVYSGQGFMFNDVPGWKISGTNIGGNAFSLSAMAECAKLVDAPDKVLVVRQVYGESVFFNSGGPSPGGVVSAQCGSDEVATGGGHQITTGPDNRIDVDLSDGPVSRVWHVEATNIGIHGFDLRALVECAKVVDASDTQTPAAAPVKLLVTRYYSDDIRVSPGNIGRAIAPCQSDEVATGGGYSIGIGAILRFTEADGANHAWVIEVQNTNRTPMLIFAMVECAKLV
jgi:hypothetical protein